MPIPAPVIVDLFDIEYKPSQVAIDHIADMVESYGFSVYKIDNFDARIWFKFTLIGTDLDGNLIIDRMQRLYELTASTDDYQYASLVTKDFQLVEEFFELLKKDYEQNNKVD